MLVGGWCALVGHQGGIKFFGVIWKGLTLAALRQLHSQNKSVVRKDHEETGFTSVGFMFLIQTETRMQAQPSMSNARLDGLGGPCIPAARETLKSIGGIQHKVEPFPLNQLSLDRIWYKSVTVASSCISNCMHIFEKYQEII